MTCAASDGNWPYDGGGWYRVFQSPGDQTDYDRGKRSIQRVCWEIHLGAEMIENLARHAPPGFPIQVLCVLDDASDSPRDSMRSMRYQVSMALMCAAELSKVEFLDAAAQTWAPAAGSRASAWGQGFDALGPARCTTPFSQSRTPRGPFNMPSVMERRGCPGSSELFVMDAKAMSWITQLCCTVSCAAVCIERLGADVARAQFAGSVAGGRSGLSVFPVILVTVFLSRPSTIMRAAAFSCLGGPR